MGIRANQTLIEEWIQRGKAKGARYCLVICDTWSLEDGFEDYPKYIYDDEDIEEVKVRYSDPSGIERLIACYNLDKEFDELTNSTYKGKYPEGYYAHTEPHTIWPKKEEN